MGSNKTLKKVEGGKYFSLHKKTCKEHPGRCIPLHRSLLNINLPNEPVFQESVALCTEKLLSLEQKNFQNICSPIIVYHQQNP